MPVKAPYLPYSKLRGIAESFLDTYHTKRTLPVPIERIIDVSFEIDIVDTPGLKRHFDVDAFITSDFSTIYVDDSVHIHRYRFSLSHELAHLLIHKDIFSALGVFHDRRVEAGG